MDPDAMDLFAAQTHPRICEKTKMIHAGLYFCCGEKSRVSTTSQRRQRANEKEDWQTSPKSLSSKPRHLIQKIPPPWKMNWKKWRAALARRHMSQVGLISQKMEIFVIQGCAIPKLWGGFWDRHWKMFDTQCIWYLLLYQKTYVCTPNLCWHISYLLLYGSHPYWLRIYPWGLAKHLCHKQRSTRPFHPYPPWDLWILGIRTLIQKLYQEYNQWWEPNVSLLHPTTGILVRCHALDAMN